MSNYIFGNNSLARLLYWFLEDDEQIVDAFLLNETYVLQAQSPIDGVPLKAAEDILEQYNPSEDRVFVTIGYADMNRTRDLVFRWLNKRGVVPSTFIHKSASISPRSDIGEGCLIMENVTIQGGSKLGRGNILWNGSNISHDARIGDFNYFSPGLTMAGRVIVGNCCFFGANATIKNDLSIGNTCLIGAGSYASKSLPNSSVLVPPRSTVLEKKSYEIQLI